MKKTKSRAHRFAVIRNNAAVVVLTFTLAFAPVGAQARQSQNRQEPAAVEKKETVPAPVSTAGKETVANNNRGRLVQEGMTIDYAIEPVSPDTKPDALMGGNDARVQFKITDTATNKPVTGLRPAAWLDYREKKQPVEQKECREKVRAFLQGSLGARPDVDLNSYFILALNKESSISVIDPIVTFGSSKLFALVLLSNPGEDWRLTRDGRKLFVTIPMSNHVAVVDTATWKVGTNVEIGARPGRIVLQKDEKYAWVGDMPMTGSPSGVTAIDTTTNKVATRITTGTGQHEIALSADDRFAFVSNTGEGTISIIDVQKLAKIKDVKIGVTTSGLAYSPLSKAVYGIDETTGVMIAVDAQSFEPIARLGVKPGIRTIRISPDGRYGFLLNPKENTAQIFDAATGKLLHTVEVGVKPDQVVFTKVFAYIRSLGSDEVLLLALKDLDKVPSVQLTHVPAGQAAPERAGQIAAAEAITPAPEGGSVLIANPADQTIYYYTEGMAAPMGNFQNYRREPRGVMVVDRSLRETLPGTYSANVKLPQGGHYDLAFLLDSPRVINCFDVAVKDNPAMAKRSDEAPLLINYLVKDVKVRPQEKANVRFRLRDPESGAAKNDLKDVGVLTFLAPGIWQERQWAKALGDGVYEIDFVPPKEGVYYIFVHCPSLKIRLNQLPFIVLDGRAELTKANNKISEK